MAELKAHLKVHRPEVATLGTLYARRHPLFPKEWIVFIPDGPHANKKAKNNLHKSCNGTGAGGRDIRKIMVGDEKIVNIHMQMNPLGNLPSANYPPHTLKPCNHALQVRVPAGTGLAELGGDFAYASWKEISWIHRWDQQHSPAVTKLTEAHLYPDNFSAMNCRLATQSLAAPGLYKQAIEGTATPLTPNMRATIIYCSWFHRLNALLTDHVLYAGCPEEIRAMRRSG